MREAELFPVVAKWVKTQGYTVLAEVKCFSGSTIDVVGWKNGVCVAVELKRGWTKSLACQAASATLITPWSYAAAPTRVPNGFLSLAEVAGFGVLHVTDHVEVVVKPHVRNSGRSLGRERRFSHWCCELVRQDVHTNLVGGVPNTAGVGIAQAVARAIADYKRQNPSATWREIFQRVPNHYASHASMRGALTGAYSYATRHILGM